MSVCEKCGTKFEPEKNVAVTTTRVLCPPCAAARAAEKLRVKSGASEPEPQASPPPRVPAAKAEQPAPRLSPKLPAKPAPVAPAKSRRAAAEDDDEDDDGSSRASSRDRDSKTMKFAWVAAGVFLIACAAVVMVIYQNKTKENQRYAEVALHQQQVFEKVQALSGLATEAASTELIAYAEANQKAWQTSENGGEITSLIAKAKNLIDREHQRKETQATMLSVESGMEQLESKAPGDIAELRRILGDIEPRADALGAEFVARVGAARTKLDRGYAVALHEDAKSYSAGNPDKCRLALQRFTAAEDEVVKLFEDAIKGKNKDAETFLKPHFMDLISESDKLVIDCFPVDSLDKLPWKDLLSGDQVAKWNPAQAKGFSHRIEDGVMTINGPDPDAKQNGLISIGDREQWRDFVVDMDFTLESGSVDMLFRLGKKYPDTMVPIVPITVGAEGIVAGKSYKLTVRMIGSTMTITYYPADLEYDPEQLGWIKSRKGALGFAVHEGTRFKITRLQVQELRASGK